MSVFDTQKTQQQQAQAAVASQSAAGTLDAIRAYDKVSYCAYDEGWQKPGEWALNIRSVVVFGRMQLVTDEEKIRKICSSLVRKFTADEAYLEQELKHALPRVQCLALIPEHMTGKLVNES